MQTDEEVVNAIFKLNQELLVPQHLGSHLLQPSLFQLQVHPQLLLQHPGTNHIHIHTNAQGCRDTPNLLKNLPRLPPPQWTSDQRCCL